jgi:hypothetical protein
MLAGGFFRGAAGAERVFQAQFPGRLVRQASLPNGWPRVTSHETRSRRAFPNAS